MKVRVIKSFINEQRVRIDKEEIFNVRRLGTTIFQAEYQVIDGKYSGMKIPYECFVEVKEEKTFTENEVKRIEDLHICKLRKLQDENIRLKTELFNIKHIISKLTERIVINDLTQMINDWTESEFEGTEAEDRKQFATKIVNYMSNIQHL